MRTLKFLSIFAALGLMGLVACKKSEPAPEAPAAEAAPAPEAEKAAPAAPTFTADELALFGTLPTEIEADGREVTEEKITLGRMLYFEARLSKNHDLSCNSCHDLAGYGVDTREKNAFSEGHKGQFGGRNSPTSYHAAGHVAQFWDGRSPDVEDQAGGPILNPIEMALPSEAVAVKTLKSMPAYVQAFKAAFPGSKNPVTYVNLTEAIGAFERRLVTPSPFDAFLGGEQEAISAEAKQGLRTFIDLGCTTCHVGTYIGGGQYQKLGLVEPYPGLEDVGRFEVTKEESDRFKFKVPSLRNIAKTGPYFHDGSIKTLPEAVRLMAKHQLGKAELSDAEVSQLVAFLESLTGEIPTDYIQAPTLPESTKKTPKPDPS